MRLEDPEMTDRKRKNYLKKIIENAKFRRKQVIALKPDATKKFEKGFIDAAEIS